MNLTLDDMSKILEVYGEVPKAPKGYEFTGEFRKPSEDDYWMQDCGTPVTRPCSWSYRRLILRKLPEPPKEYTYTVSTVDIYPKGYKIPEGYEYAAFALTKYANPVGATHVLDLYGNPAPASAFYPESLRILLKKKA